MRNRTQSSRLIKLTHETPSMGLRSLGIVIALIGVLSFLFWDGGGSTTGIGMNVIVGLILVVVGIWMFNFNPVEEMKNTVVKGAAETIRKTAPTEQEAVKKVDEVADTAKRTVSDKQREAKQKINQLAKEVQKLTEEK